MKKLILATVFLVLLIAPSVRATTYFEFTGESGYQYMGPGSPHPGGGYFSNMGGAVSKPEGANPCLKDTNNYHYTVLTNEPAAKGATPGVDWALKTPYPGACPDEGFVRDTTIINLASGLQEVYIRWYQKWTGDWNSASVQQKFFKTENGASNYLQMSFGVTPTQVWRAYLPNVENHFDKDGIARASAVWVYASRAQEQAQVPGCEYGGTACAYDDDATTTGITFATNVWYYLEIHIKINTDSSTSDGVMEAWVNGAKVFGASNFKYYATGTLADWTVGSFELQHIYYNRSANDQPTYMNNIKISDTYIGPGAQAYAPWVHQ